MQLYKLHIIKNIIPIFLMSTLVIICLIWTTQIIKLLYLMDKGISLSNFLSVITYIVPHLLFITLPIIVTISVIYCFNNFAEERQLIILKTSGVSNIELAKPALYFTIIVTIFAYVISLELLPSSYIKLKSRLHYIKNNYVSNLVAEKTFNQLSKSITIYINKKLPSGKLEGLVIFDNRDLNAPSILFVKEGDFYLKNKNLILYLKEGIRQIYDKRGNPTNLNFNEIIIELEQDNLNEVTKNIEDRDINELFLSELLFPPSHISFKRRNILLIEGHQRIIWPLYCLILPYLSLGIFLKFSGKNSYHIYKIIFAVSIIVYLHFSFINFAAKNPSLTFLCHINWCVALLIAKFLFNDNKI